jgi:hypothetical protein
LAFNSCDYNFWIDYHDILELNRVETFDPNQVGASSPDIAHQYLMLIEIELACVNGLTLTKGEGCAQLNQ